MNNYIYSKISLFDRMSGNKYQTPPPTRPSTPTSPPGAPKKGKAKDPHRASNALGVLSAMRGTTNLRNSEIRFE